jgi:hypothetical protein
VVGVEYTWSKLPGPIRFHQNDVSNFDSICRGILPLWNLDF